MSGWKYAFSLSKEEVKEATPPGTVLLIDHHSGEKSLENGQGQEGSDRGEIIRFPRPSSDPADPLNWPTWRKNTILLLAGFYAFMGNFQSSIIAPALATWYKAYPTQYKPYENLVHLLAVNVLFMGASNIWWVPLAHVFGRRPVMLTGTLLLTLGSVWCGLASSYNSALAARMFQGMGGGPSETVAAFLVGEIFFIDERGRAMAIYTSLLALGSLVGGISGGYIAYPLGWAYNFWVTTALSGALFLGIFVFVPETLYDRKLPTEPRGESAVTTEDHSKTGTHFVENRDIHPSNSHDSDHQYRPFTFTRALGFGKVQRGIALDSFVRPWRTLALPGTWLVMLQYSGLVGGVVTVSVVGAQIVLAPPYLWGANAGLLSIGSLIGVLLGALYTYLTADARLLGKAKREGHGYAEPESRLPTMWPSLLIATLGLFVFGFCAQYPRPNMWVGLQVGGGMLAFGLMQVPSIGFNYLIDSYSYLASDCFVIVTILRSIISFAWTFFVSGWVTDRGAAEPFGIFGMFMGLFSLLTIPVFYYGKRSRIATAKMFETSS